MPQLRVSWRCSSPPRVTPRLWPSDFATAAKRHRCSGMVSREKMKRESSRSLTGLAASFDRLSALLRGETRGGRKSQERKHRVGSPQVELCHAASSGFLSTGPTAADSSRTGTCQGRSRSSSYIISDSFPAFAQSLLRESKSRLDEFRLDSHFPT